jgi:hypothetical protein
MHRLWGKGREGKRERAKDKEEEKLVSEVLSSSRVLQMGRDP